MQINEYRQKGLREDRVDLFYREKSKDIAEILDYLRKYDDRMIGRSGQQEVVFSIHDVYYFESVDKKTFACLKDAAVRIEISLQELESVYCPAGFIRVNKSTVLNIYKVQSLKTDFNMRVLGILDNGDRIQVNRSYKHRFNQFLKEMSEGGKHREADS